MTRNLGAVATVLFLILSIVIQNEAYITLIERRLKLCTRSSHEDDSRVRRWGWWGPNSLLQVCILVTALTKTLSFRTEYCCMKKPKLLLTRTLVLFIMCLIQGTGSFKMKSFRYKITSACLDGAFFLQIKLF